MFKKNIWIVGLLVALTMMFVGCVPEFVDEEGEMTEVFNLQDALDSADLGVLDANAWKAVFGDTPLHKCGDGATFSIITQKGVKKLKIDKMTETWGQGVDLYSLAVDGSTKGANFKAGDTIFIKGSVDAGKNGLKMSIGNGSAKFDGWASDATFDKEYVLTAANIGDIKGASPKALRFCYDAPNGDGRMGTIIFEEMILKGKRKAGDGSGGGPAVEEKPEADPTYGKVYTPTDDTASVLYVNLNNIGLKGAVAPGGIAASAVAFTAGKITISFPANANDQRAIFKLTDEQVAKIMNSGSINVVIDGTFTGTGNSFRYHLGDPRTGSNWNGTNSFNADAFATIAADKKVTFSGNFSGATVGYFILQYRNAAAGTLEINSIKLTLNPVTDVLASGLDINLTPPKAGVNAPTSVNVTNTVGTGDDAVTTTYATGSITWTPGIPTDGKLKGKFDLSTAYRATIVLSPAPGYSIPYTLTKTSFSPVGFVISDYNPSTKTITTGWFTKTDTQLPPLPDGQFWKMTTWLVDEEADFPVGYNGNNLWDSRPFQYNDYKAGALTTIVVVDKAAKTVTIPAASRDAAHKGIDIYIGEQPGGLGIDPTIYKVEVTIKGKIISTGAEVKCNFVVEESDGSYTKVLNKAVTVTASADLTIDEKAEIPANFNPAQKLRIHPSVANIGFVLTEVIFDNKGLR